ncbi:hypothetical protein GGR56DRAFT_689038 [Xylariaceae sp. FL0804]|nr:hypothetical protein GGR56DRAFT_689038 [Xylariaceae sp. FL0804]
MDEVKERPSVSSFEPPSESDLFVPSSAGGESTDPCPVWRQSELKSARDYIEEDDVQFTGNGMYDDNGRFFVNNPGEIDYISGPTPEVDLAWRNLSGARDFKITEEEAKELWPNNYKIHYHRKYGGYMVGLDVFHTLHCLNNLRKYYYPDVYPVKPGHEESSKVHRGHCLDQIRQYVMCNADLTPYSYRWFPNPGRMYADSDVTHSCRNWDRIRDWTTDRFHAGGDLHIEGVEVWEPFADGL